MNAQRLYESFRTMLINWQVVQQASYGETFATLLLTTLAAARATYGDEWKTKLQHAIDSYLAGGN